MLSTSFVIYLYNVFWVSGVCARLRKLMKEKVTDGAPGSNDIYLHAREKAH